MGSPLAPLLANWFVCMMENNVLNNPSISQPLFYRRYVDDVFAIFRCEEDRDVFFNHLNAAHDNLIFTMEMPNIDSHALPFLDVEVSITESNRFLTKVYRKPTNTDVIMKHCAIAPVKWKKSLLQLLLLRAKKLSSTQEAFEEEVKNIKRIFQSNGYPVSFIDNGVSSFLEKNEDNVTPKITDCEKMAYLVLPYIGKCSKRLHRKISAIMQGHEITLVQAFRTVKVESYFSLKTKIPYLFKSDVVYKFVCSRDENTQICMFS